MSQEPQPTLQLFVDLGSSITKIVYTYQSKMSLLLMPPETANVTLIRVKEFMDINFASSPVDGAWIKLEGEDAVVAVGRLAENFNGNSALKQRKIQPGLYRILGALGVLKAVLNLPNEFTCDLGIALPVAEYRDRQDLVDSIKANAQFICRDDSLSVNYQTIQILPEGMGLILERRAEVRRLGLPRKSTVALMCGHRNLSILVFEGDSLKQGHCRSDGPGFVHAIEIAAKQLGVEPDIAGLVEAVAANHSTLRVQGQLKPLDISQAVQEGRLGYWKMVEAYLKSNLPGGDYDLICGGGASWAMLEEFSALLSQSGFEGAGMDELYQRIDKLLHSDLKHEKGKPINLLLPMQMADAYVGLYNLIALSNKRQASLVGV
ncbi:MAG TPA: ParM/StbA family protein [Coleofasciculaceae cyanobacterium]